jgi:flagellar biosynthetic protein FlhB
MADKGLQTEQPTQRRIEKARRDGRFPVSRDFVAAVQFLAFVGLVAASGGRWFESLLRSSRVLLAAAFRRDLDAGDLLTVCRNLITRELLPLAAAGAMLTAATLAAQLAGTNFGLAPKRFIPDLARLNPLQRARELPRQNLAAFSQAALLLPLFAWTVYEVARNSLDSLLVLPLTGVRQGAAQVWECVRDLLWKAAAVFLALGAIDFWRQQRRYTRDLRMTKQEIREESKENEGNPQVRMRIRRLQRDLLRRQMMSQVPKATAVIVNPTHYAVAVRYAMDSMPAPAVIAKGRNYLALRIRQRAVEHQVPVVENPPLARALYESTEVGQEIPAHLYRAVAEVLAYIYRVMRGRLPGAL